ncbi:MAG: hypothetical protein GXY28_11735 [Bacteriovoracaceae bacterium]|jgi:hypothetical protein|nr:hypothetical protein [Deltaproteobacteria bacterium]NLW68456.1 hypothetical protein [Bacteriovoracaceae bacterium]HPX48875.1 hypothetical protein [Deltaproteobacteria bacterium]HQA71191.1 hypothetical protein [Deltaproteobacteria bacterium]
MNDHDSSVIMLTAIAVFLCIAMPVSCAGNNNPEKPSGEVTREVEEAAEAIRDYSIEQRDEAIRQGRRALEDIDVRMRALRQRLNEHWDEMEPEVRSRARDTLESLRVRRNETARWLDEIRTSSENAWDKVKQGFVRSYEDLRASFERADKRY